MARAEILSIGTELLLGQILNTNSQFLSQELAKLGIDCLWNTTVGDNKQRIKECVFQALNHAEIVITSGGLGPTTDDLTHESLAELFGVQMQLDQDTLQQIKAFFRKRGLPMPESNRKQAMRPDGSNLLPNPMGTAPCIILKVNGQLLQRIGVDNPDIARYIITFPGVPAELKTMWSATAASFLSSVFDSGIIWSCDLKHYGIGESALAEMHLGLMHKTNPTVAPYAGNGECRLRVTAKAESVEKAQDLARPIIEEIISRSGNLFYGFNDSTLESVVGNLLKSKQLSLATAESCSGGLLSKRLTDIAGSSAYTKLNLITYSNEAKEKFIGVSRATLEEFGAVSAQCAQEMAQGVAKTVGSDLGLSITGIAGPDGGSEEKPVGLVYIGLYHHKPNQEGKDGSRLKTLQLAPNLTRSEIRYRSTSEALNLLRLYLLDLEQNIG
jgi:nicotinamide-nucleotide amidase